jgi:hypothetical protein
MNDLRGICAPKKVEFGSSSRIYGAAIVAAAFAVFVIYGFATGHSNVQQPHRSTVSDSSNSGAAQ